jgi:hypothetical protein
MDKFDFTCAQFSASTGACSDENRSEKTSGLAPADPWSTRSSHAGTRGAFFDRLAGSGLASPLLR